MTASGRANVLMSKCHLCAAVNPNPGQAPNYIEYAAIWDTGATNCAISQRVVDALGLKQTGTADVHHADGVAVATPTYMINVRLPTGVDFNGVIATLARGVAGGDILIGMDIIGLGDFAVNNVGGITSFSYRNPSIKKIDYVEEARQLKARTPAPKQPFWKGIAGKKKRH
jgi:predicted aspartyl protease